MLNFYISILKNPIVRCVCISIFLGMIGVGIYGSTKMVLGLSTAAVVQKGSTYADTLKTIDTLFQDSRFSIVTEAID